VGRGARVLRDLKPEDLIKNPIKVPLELKPIRNWHFGDGAGNGLISKGFKPPERFSACKINSPV